MTFKETKLTLDDIIKDVHQDYAVTILSIHDEIDNLVDVNLREPLTYELSKIAENKAIFDRFGYKYINTFFDFEYNKDNGSFATNSSFDALKLEAERYKEKFTISAIENKEENPESAPHKNTTIIIYLNYVNETQLKELSTLPIGDYNLVIDVNGKQKFKFNKNVALDKSVLSKFNYQLV